MAGLKTRLFPTLSPEEYTRRLRLFRTLLTVQVITTVALVLSGIMDSLDTVLALVLVVALGLVTILFSLLGFHWAKRSHIHGGVLLMLAGLMLCLGYFVLFYGTRGTLPFFFVWPIMVGAILLEPALAILVTTLVALFYGTASFLELFQVWAIPFHFPERFAFWHVPEETVVVLNYIAATLEVIIIYYAATFLSWITSRSLRQEVERSQQQAAEVERYRAELEKKVFELSQTTEQLEASLREIREIGSPVLPIFEGVLLVPLIGTIDSERAQLVMERVLHQVTKRRARAVLLDITAVSMVDTAVANALLQTARGVRLLGAVPVLVGVRAEVAETIVALDVDLEGIATRAGLQEGLEYALEEIERDAEDSFTGWTI